MEADAFITLFIEHVDQVSATDGDNTALRSERTNDLNEVIVDVCDASDWSWLLRYGGSVSIASGSSSAVVPALFGNPSAKGAVFRTSDGEQLTYRRPEIIKARQLDTGDRPSLPDEYSFFDIDSSGQTPTYRELIQTPVLSAAATLGILYKDEPPEVVDLNNGVFLKIPERIQRGAIWAGMRAKAQYAKGDGRAVDFREDPGYQRALSRHIKAEQKGKEEVGQMPSFFGA